MVSRGMGLSTAALRGLTAPPPKAGFSGPMAWKEISVKNMDWTPPASMTKAAMSLKSPWGMVFLGAAREGEGAERDAGDDDDACSG